MTLQDRALAHIHAISAIIDDSYPTDLSAESHLWRRLAKVGEESGEVISALLGYLGENPRKGQTCGIDDVYWELLDVALCALAAAAHLDNNDGDQLRALFRHAEFVHERLIGVVGERR